MSELLYFNGVNAATGEYLLPAMDAGQLGNIIRGEPVDPQLRDELKLWYRFLTSPEETFFVPKEGVDPKDLAQTGWGAIFPYNSDPAIQAALEPLLKLRQAQAGARYHCYTGPEGYRPGESKRDWLERHGAGPGPVDPDSVPYYLLLVGAPDTIPYHFQSQLDVQYAVGRIWFETPAEYAGYAQSVAQAEQQSRRLPRRAVFAGPANPDDAATRLSSDNLVLPLAAAVTADKPDWQVATRVREDAGKAAFTRLLGGADTPALLFSASHGACFPADDPRQPTQQGALITQDWPGPRQWRQPLDPGFLFTAADLPAGANLWGMIGFFFACYGAGTPMLDEFSAQALKKERAQIAPRSFLAQLPMRMLAHPNGGALAVIGHVDRAWGYSFQWGKAGTQLAVYESALKRLMEGHPIGSAFEYFNSRYAELSSDLSSTLEDIQYGKKVDAGLTLELAGMWTANNDARNFIVLGDPAVRLMVGDDTPLDKLGGRPELVEGDAVKGLGVPSDTTLTPALSPGERGKGDTSPDRRSGGVEGDTAERLGVPSDTTLTPPSPLRADLRLSQGEREVSGLEYGLVDDIRAGAANLGSSMQEFLQNLGKFLSAAIEDATTLKVCTYVSSEIDKVTVQNGVLNGATMRALTYVKVDGDTLVCVPQDENGEIDTALWAVHLETVKQAQASRADLIRAAIAAAASLANPAGGARSTSA